MSISCLGDRFQLVWWWRDWEWPGFHWAEGSMAQLYRWSFFAGPLEIRRWK